MVQIKTNYLLFDFDGTLVNSTPAVEKTWHNTVAEHNKQYPEAQIDPVQFLHTAHGARTVETFKKHFPYRDNDTDAVNAFEFGIVDNYGHLAVEINGSLELLAKLEQDAPTKWAIVTSGTRDLAHGWFRRLFSQFKKPLVFITANDVSKGKPDPEGYATAFTRLCELEQKSLNSSTAIIFEDAPTGVKAGVAGGFTVVGIASTFSKEALQAAGAKYIVRDMLKVSVQKDGEYISVELDVL